MYNNKCILNVHLYIHVIVYTVYLVQKTVMLA